MSRDSDYDPDTIDEFDTIPPVADPDRTQTESVDLMKMRERIEAEKKRFKLQRERTEEPDDGPTAEHTEDVPDDLFDVPITRESNVPDSVKRAIDPDEVETDEPDGAPRSPPGADRTPDLDPGPESDADPTPVPRPVSKAARRRPGRPGAGGSMSSNGAIIANLAVLGLLTALAFLILVLWLAFG